MPTANEPITHRESWRIPAWLGLCGRYDAVIHLRTPIAMINTGDALVALNTVKELMPIADDVLAPRAGLEGHWLLLTSFGSGYVAGAYLRWLVPSRA